MTKSKVAEAPGRHLRLHPTAPLPARGPAGTTGSYPEALVSATARQPMRLLSRCLVTNRPVLMKAPPASAPLPGPPTPTPPYLTSPGPVLSLQSSLLKYSSSCACLSVHVLCPRPLESASLQTCPCRGTVCSPCARGGALCFLCLPVSLGREGNTVRWQPDLPLSLTDVQGGFSCWCVWGDNWSDKSPPLGSACLPRLGGKTSALQGAGVPVLSVPRAGWMIPPILGSVF